MDSLTIKLPAGMLAQVLAAKLDADGICCAALRAALEGKRLVPQEEPRKPGRPAGRTREQRAVNLEPRVWAWLERQKADGESLNNTLNRLLLGLMGGTGG